MPTRRTRTAPLLRCASTLALGLALALSISACKKKNEGPTCKPEDHAKFKVRVLVQPTNDINPDESGAPLPTLMRIYQLTSDEKVPLLDYREVWDKGKDVFGDTFVAETEHQVYPGKPDMVEIEPDPKANYVLAIALFREPTGSSWYRLWDVPKYHGDSVCLAERQKKTWAVPCFYVSMERSTIDGGHTPPASFDKALAGV
ncbi:MAG: type VI secretion system lipoprotein TssJ, partial [Microthrixaceae bacterium]|nr:type VI secretion system lipoprotein TssJ [Microthrixaceae bacterium]